MFFFIKTNTNPPSFSQMWGGHQRKWWWKYHLMCLSLIPEYIQANKCKIISKYFSCLIKIHVFYIYPIPWNHVIYSSAKSAIKPSHLIYSLIVHDSCNVFIYTFVCLILCVYAAGFLHSSTWLSLCFDLKILACYFCSTLFHHSIWKPAIRQFSKC